LTTLDHLGIVVPSIERAVPRWSELFGYVPATMPVVNSEQRVRVVFLDSPESVSIKLVEPTSGDSPVHSLARRQGGLHHVCFRADSIDDEVERLVARGARLITPPQPGEAFEGERIAFLYVDGLNVEVIDTLKRTSRIVR
jgi:methylmalonyl-CoA/ethylmalonyl-CoA epimerase